jgi:hypothetical protein
MNIHMNINVNNAAAAADDDDDYDYDDDVVVGHCADYIGLPAGGVSCPGTAAEGNGENLFSGGRLAAARRARQNGSCQLGCPMIIAFTVYQNSQCWCV